MGIQLWALRRSEQQPLPETNIDTKQAAINVAVPVKLIVVMAAAPMSAPAQRLFNAMLKAASLNSDEVLTIAPNEFGKINTATLANKSVLMLGTEVAAELMPDLSPDKPASVTDYQAQFFACFSLEDMLQQPSRKAAAWHALKHLSPVF